VQQSSAAPTDDEPEDLHTAAFASSVEPQQTTANRQTGDGNDNDDSSNSNNPFNGNLHSKNPSELLPEKNIHSFPVFLTYFPICVINFLQLLSSIASFLFSC